MRSVGPFALIPKACNWFAEADSSNRRCIDCSPYMDTNASFPLWEKTGKPIPLGRFPKSRPRVGEGGVERGGRGRELCRACLGNRIGLEPCSVLLGSYIIVCRHVTYKCWLTVSIGTWAVRTSFPYPCKVVNHVIVAITRDFNNWRDRGLTEYCCDVQGERCFCFWSVQMYSELLTQTCLE